MKIELGKMERAMIGLLLYHTRDQLKDRNERKLHSRILSKIIGERTYTELKRSEIDRVLKLIDLALRQVTEESNNERVTALQVAARVLEKAREASDAA